MDRQLNRWFLGVSCLLGGILIELATRMKMVVFVTLLMGGIFCLRGESLGQTEEKVGSTASPFPATVDSTAQGKELFMQGCAICHGDRGRGDGTAAVALEASPRDLSDAEFMGTRTDGELFKTITEGKNEMPSFEEAYTEEERWHIINYVRTFSQSD